jgi:hypothetical protein
MTIRWIDEEKCASIFFKFQYWLFKSNGHLNVNDKHKREICEVENLISITSTKKRFVREEKKHFTINMKMENLILKWIMAMRMTFHLVFCSTKP